MPKIQWERLPREKWAHLRDRAKERKVSERDCSNWPSGRPKIPMCRMENGIRTSGPSSSAARGNFRALFCWPDSPPGAGDCDRHAHIRIAAIGSKARGELRSPGQAKACPTITCRMKSRPCPAAPTAARRPAPARRPPPSGRPCAAARLKHRSPSRSY